MFTGRLILHQYHEVIRGDRYDASPNSNYLKSTLDTLFRVQILRLPAVPPMILNNQLPPNLSVSQPMFLRFFPVCLEDLPLPKRTEASKCFEKSLHWGSFPCGQVPCGR